MPNCFINVVPIGLPNLLSDHMSEKGLYQKSCSWEWLRSYAIIQEPSVGQKGERGVMELAILYLE